jgi:hypothetical protein
VTVPPRMREAHRAGLGRVAQGGPPRMIGARNEMTGLHRDGRELRTRLSGDVLHAVSQEPDDGI